MFDTLKPPCQPGRGPGRNNLMCERCDVGKFAPAQSFCQECPEGWDGRKLGWQSVGSIWLKLVIRRGDRRDHEIVHGVGVIRFEHGTIASLASFVLPCLRFNSFRGAEHVRRVLGVALLYERRRWLLPLQLAIGVGGQQVRVWAMRPSNDIVFSTPFRDILRHGNPACQ